MVVTTLDESTLSPFELFMEELPYDYVLFIDEAGDDGLARVKPIDADGASEWLVLSGVLVRAEDEGRTRVWLDQIRRDINALQSPVLHFKKLSPTKRVRAASMLGELPVRIFTVCSNKKNMRGHRNERAAMVDGKQWFYNWVVRILMERATNYCLRNSLKKLNRPGKVKVLFSSRGGHSYGQTKAYWEYLKAQGTPFLNKYHIKFEVLSYRLIDYVPHYMHAGLQLADIAASSFYQAVETDSLKWSNDSAKSLEPKMARAGNTVADCGLVLQPHKIDTIGLSALQKEIFEHYGFAFRAR